MFMFRWFDSNDSTDTFKLQYIFERVIMKGLMKMGRKI